ncbi:MAG: hypothetical protein P1T08_13845 [Acidimicrobiia bacterium]|nr:hypothetical protein [Acidimicrobiia bacterium]
MRVVPVESKQLQPRPPVAPATPDPAGTTPPTLRHRLHIQPHLLAGSGHRRVPTDPYVRRFWTAALGPGAVADLLRLIRAAQRERSLPRPEHLSDLIRVGLAGHAEAGVWVAASIPDVPPADVRRLPPYLRREHHHWLTREQNATTLDL